MSFSFTITFTFWCKLTERTSIIQKFPQAFFFLQVFRYITSLWPHSKHRKNAESDTKLQLPNEYLFRIWSIEKQKNINNTNTVIWNCYEPYKCQFQWEFLKGLTVLNNFLVTKWKKFSTWKVFFAVDVVVIAI